MQGKESEPSHAGTPWSYALNHQQCPKPADSKTAIEGRTCLHGPRWTEMGSLLGRKWEGEEEWEENGCLWRIICGKGVRTRDTAGRITENRVKSYTQKYSAWNGGATRVKRCDIHMSIQTVSALILKMSPLEKSSANAVRGTLLWINSHHRNYWPCVL